MVSRPFLRDRVTEFLFPHRLHVEQGQPHQPGEVVQLPDGFGEQITKVEFIELAEQSGNFDTAAIEFQRRVLANSGIGDESYSYMPRWVFRPAGKATFRPRAPLVPVFPPGKAATLRGGRTEASQVMFGAVDDLIAATGVQSRDIRVLVVNCGVLNTTPSLAAMMINRYKLRRDVHSYNLGGMRCAVGLARDLLGAHPGSLGLVVSTEAVSATWYAGNELDMLVLNCFFRMGAAALLLSSRHRDWWRSKYELLVLGTGDGLSAWNRSGRPLRFVLIRGQPLNEPVVQYRPFVMNTQAKIEKI